jgi:two-component system response regulator RegA
LQSAARWPRSILVVDDDAHYLRALQRSWKPFEVELVLAENLAGAVGAVDERPVDAALVDYCLEEQSGLEVLVALRARCPSLWIAIMSNWATIDLAVDAVRLGAADCFEKGLHPDEVLSRIHRAPDPRAVPRRSRSVRSLAALERQQINRALTDCGGNVSAAARRLGIHRRTLQRKLRKDSPLR